MVAGRTLPDLLKVLWRRKFWILAAALLGAGGAYGVYRAIDPLYRATTLILVEPQRVPSDYIKPTVTSSLDDRVKTIEQQITNRENLQQILRDTALYEDLIGAGRLDKAIRRIRRNLVVEVRGGNVFWVHFKGSSPEQAATVANRVADAFIGENLRLREGQAEDTTAFLTSELAEMKQQLEEQEGRVSSFRLLHDGDLPEQRAANEAAIARLEAELDRIGDKTDSAELRVLILEGGLAAPSGDPRRGDQKAAVTAPPSRLSVLKDQLRDLRLLYTERHPEVIRLQQEIARLQKEPSEPVQVAEEPPVESGDERADSTLKAELQAARMELEQLDTERGLALEEIAVYQHRLERTARVELDLLAMTRDYDNLQKAYESLLAKRIDASLAENMEKGRQSEQFTILERATPPNEPYSPDLLVCLGVGIAASALLAIGLVVLKEETGQTFHDADDLSRSFPGVPVLASVPRITNLEEESALEEAV